MSFTSLTHFRGLIPFKKFNILKIIAAQARGAISGETPVSGVLDLSSPRGKNRCLRLLPSVALIGSGLGVPELT
jgi:hypothetical protein